MTDQPNRRRSRSLRRAALAIVIAAAAATTMISALGSAAGSEPAATFVAASSQPDLSIYSAATGARVELLARFGDDFTNNGLAVSPDGSTVYFTLIPRRARGSFGLR